MDRLLQLSARLDNLIELSNLALLGGGRVHNQLYHPDSHTTKPRRIGKGTEQLIPISKILSPQATVHSKKVRSLADKMKRGTLGQGSLPEVQQIGDLFHVFDGNHRIMAAKRAGKRSLKVLVQR